MGALHVAGSFEIVFLRGTSALSKPRWRVARRVGENVIESVTLSREVMVKKSPGVVPDEMKCGVD